MYSKRIKWLMQSSRKVFGLVQGERVAVLIDSSNSNMGFGRAIEIQDALLVNFNIYLTTTGSSQLHQLNISGYYILMN